LLTCTFSGGKIRLGHLIGLVDPIPSFYASVTRKTLEGLPEGGYEADQKMTREEALKSYTLDGAFAEFEEDFKGSIEVPVR